MSSHVLVTKRSAPVVEDEAGAIPPDLLLRRDRSVRYERGGTVYATDGRVGVLKLVVVDEGAGEVEDLVIEVDADTRNVLVPPDLVDKTAGSAVFLTVNRTQFFERSAHAPVYEKARFERADTKALTAKGGSGENGTPRRAVSQVGRDFVETPAGSLLDRLDRSGG